LESQLSAHGRSLEDAVKHYLEHLKKNPITTATIDRLTERWIKCVENDKNKNNRQRTINDLKSFSVQLSRDFKDVLITEASRSLVSENINKLRKKDGSELSQQTRKNYLSKTKQFFNWAVSEELISTNPIALEKVRVDQHIPKAYSVQDAIIITKLVQKDKYKTLIPYICIGLFSGLRPTEVERINWSNIHFDNNIISVEPNQTKVKRSRHAELNNTLKSWLNISSKHKQIKPRNFQRLFKSFKKELNIEWIPDGLRHTYATYWLPINQNKDLLANYMGNSRSVIDKHYLKPALKQDAEKFWKLIPDGS
jgi:integrase